MPITETSIRNKERIESLLLRGLKPAEIKMILPGINHSYIYPIYRRLGLPSLTMGRPLNPKAAEVDRLLRLGIRPNDIKKEVTGVSSAFISNRRSVLGIPKFKTGRIIGVRNVLNRMERIYELLKTKSQSEIAEIIGVTRQAISNALNPEKSTARSLAKRAIQDGRIIKPKHCNACCRKLKLEAHHEDYSKPLEVVFLCKKCHMKRHVEIRNKK